MVSEIFYIIFFLCLWFNEKKIAMKIYLKNNFENESTKVKCYTRGWRLKLNIKNRTYEPAYKCLFALHSFSFWVKLCFFFRTKEISCIYVFKMLCFIKYELEKKESPLWTERKQQTVSQSVRKGVDIKMTEHSRIDSIIKLFYNFSLQSSLYKSAWFVLPQMKERWNEA